MTEINEIYNTLNTLTSPENLTYAILGITGAFILTAGTFFYSEWKKFKKVEENKIKNNLDNKL